MHKQTRALRERKPPPMSKFQPKVIRDSNPDFQINLDPDVCRICLEMFQIHDLVGISHFARIVQIRDVKPSRPNWPQGQNFCLGLVTSSLGPRDPLALASSFWSRPRTLIFNFQEPGVLSFPNTSESPSKKETHSTAWSL